MGALLKNLSRVPWGDLLDARQRPASGIPPLLSRVAYGDGSTALAAVDELGEALCSLGFVVGEATAPAVPFLLDLLGAPHVRHRAAIAQLLEDIHGADQWHASAAAAGGRGDPVLRERAAWEAASRAAVRAGRPTVEALAGAVPSAETDAARSLLRAMDGVRPFPAL